MEIQGKLTKDKWGYTMPVSAPAYQRQPYFFKKARMLRFDYETDKESAAELIPEQFSVPDSPTAVVTFAEYPWSTVGPYREAILGLNVKYKGQDINYMIQLILSENMPIMGGREVYGYPKTMGVIEFVEEDGMMAAYVERPKGIRICSGVLRPEYPGDPFPDKTPVEACALRVIPSPEEGKDHSLVELIQSTMIFSNTEVWMGTGNCHFTGASVLDPWHMLPVVNHIAASYMVCDFELTGGKVLETF
jgi:acetoacetate decarboxylase